MTQHQVVVRHVVVGLPTFGEGGSSLLQLVGVARYAVTAVHPIDDVAAPILLQSLHHVAEAHIASCQRIASLLNIVHKGIQCALTQAIGGDAGIESHCQSCLAAILIDLVTAIVELTGKGLLHLFSCTGKCFCIAISPQMTSYLLHHGQLIIVHGSCRESHTGELRLTWSFRTYVKPVAEPIVENATLGTRTKIGDIALHGLIVLAHGTVVAIP